MCKIFLVTGYTRSVMSQKKAYRESSHRRMHFGRSSGNAIRENQSCGEICFLPMKLFRLVNKRTNATIFATSGESVR